MCNPKYSSETDRANIENVGLTSFIYDRSPLCTLQASIKFKDSHWGNIRVVPRAG